MSALSKSITNKDRQIAISRLESYVRHDLDYYILLIGAILLALGAIFIDSIPVLIASMIVAPLAQPILGLGLGLATGNGRLFLRASLLLVGSCLIALGIGVSATMLFGNNMVVDKYVTFTSSRDIAFLLSVAAGIVAAYGLVRPKVAPAITGVAIAVSLLPPLVATGVGLAPGGKTDPSDPWVLFAINVAGILLASTTVFLLFGLRRAARR